MCGGRWPCRLAWRSGNSRGIRRRNCTFVCGVRVLQSQIFGVDIYDPLTLMSVVLALALIGGLAICLPTLRIGRMEPAETLRSE